MTPYSDRNTLVALLKQARQDPYEETTHGVIADALDEAHPGTHVGSLIRRQFGLTGDEPRHNEWYDPIFNAGDHYLDGYRRLGTHGPFDVYLGHEGGPEQTSRWVVHAVSGLKGSRDFGYTFEFPHEEAHLIPQMFPAAAEHISPQDVNGGDDGDFRTQYRGRDMMRRDEAEAFQRYLENGPDDYAAPADSRTDYADRGPHLPFHPQRNPGGHTDVPPDQSLFVWGRGHGPLTWPPHRAGQPERWSTYDVHQLVPTQIGDNWVWMPTNQGVQRRVDEPTAELLMSPQAENYDDPVNTEYDGNYPTHWHQFRMENHTMRKLTPGEMLRTGLWASPFTDVLNDPDDFVGRLSMADWLEDNDIQTGKYADMGGGLHNHFRAVADRIQKRLQDGKPTLPPDHDAPPRPITPDDIDHNATKLSRYADGDEVVFPHHRDADSANAPPPRPPRFGRALTTGMPGGFRAVAQVVRRVEPGGVVRNVIDGYYPYDPRVHGDWEALPMAHDIAQPTRPEINRGFELDDRADEPEHLSRYGWAPGEDVNSFLHEAMAEGATNPQNNTDHVLADFFEDHDDPRHLIVRRDLAHRQGTEHFPNSWSEGLYDHMTSISGAQFHQRDWALQTTHDLPDGTYVTATPFRTVNRDGNLSVDPGPVVGYEISFASPRTGHAYAGAFSPEEHAHIMRQIEPPAEDPEQFAAYDRTDYSPAEQRAFMEQLRTNWGDSTGHAVFADWMEEHGDPREAAFRRDLAAWLQTAPLTDHTRPKMMPDQAPWWFDHAAAPDSIDAIHPVLAGEDPPGHSEEFPFRNVWARSGDGSLNWTDPEYLESSLRQQWELRNPLNHARVDYGQDDFEPLFRHVAGDHHDHTTHGAIADNLEESYPHTKPLADLIRHHSGVLDGQPKYNGANVGYFGPMPGGLHGANLGEVGPFRVYGAHPFIDPRDGSLGHDEEHVDMFFHPLPGGRNTLTFFPDLSKGTNHSTRNQGLESTDPDFHIHPAWAAHGGYYRPVGYHFRMPVARAVQMMAEMGTPVQEEPDTGPDAVDHNQTNLSRYMDYGGIRTPEVPAGFEDYADFEAHVKALTRFGMKATEISQHLNAPVSRVKRIAITVPKEDRPDRTNTSNVELERNQTRGEWVMPFDVRMLHGHDPRGRAENTGIWDSMRQVIDTGGTYDDVADMIDQSQATARNKLNGLRLNKSRDTMEGLRRQIHEQEGIPILPIQSLSSNLSRYADDDYDGPRIDNVPTYGHMDFIRAIAPDMNERTNFAAYSDWLREQGKHAHADMIDRAAEGRFGHTTAFETSAASSHWAGMPQGSTPFHINTMHYPLRPGEPEQWHIDLSSQLSHGVDGYQDPRRMVFTHGPFDVDTAMDIADRLINEGSYLPEGDHLLNEMSRRDHEQAVAERDARRAANGPDSIDHNQTNLSRYGMLDRPTMESFVDQGLGDGVFDANNTADAVMADAMQDADDPRHEIVRRDLQHREGAYDLGSFLQNEHDHHGQMAPRHPTYRLGTHHPEYERIALPDGTDVTVAPWGDGSQVYSYSLIWDMPRTMYRGAFHPDEAKPLIERLRAEGTSDRVEHPPEQLSRYGLMPGRDVEHWAEQGYADGQFDGNNTADAVFADALEEADDPRHVIVRRDLHHRRDNGMFENVWRAHSDLAGGFHGGYEDDSTHLRFRMPDGSLINVLPKGPIDPYESIWSTAAPTSHEITWRTPINERSVGNTYYGVFYPDETADLLARLQQEGAVPDVRGEGRYADDRTPTEYGDHQDLVNAMTQNPWESDVHLRLADLEAEQGNEPEAVFREKVGRWLPERVKFGANPSPRTNTRGPFTWLDGPHQDEPLQARTYVPGVFGRARFMKPRFSTGPWNHPVWDTQHGHNFAFPEQVAEFFGVPREDALTAGTLQAKLPMHRSDDWDYTQLNDGEMAYLGMNHLDPDTDPTIWPQIETLLRERHRLGHRFAGDTTPVPYGTEEDEQAFRSGITANPLELTNHLVFADWLQDHDKPEESELRRKIADSIQRRLSTPWKPLLTDRNDFLDQQSHGPEDETYHQDVKIRSAGDYADFAHMRPALSGPNNSHWTTPHRGLEPDGTFVWDVHDIEHALPGNDPKLAGLPWMGAWRDARMVGTAPGMAPIPGYPSQMLRGAHVLAPAERLFAGIDNLANVDPAIWPQVEALMKDRHDRGQRLSRYDRTDYDADEQTLSELLHRVSNLHRSQIDPTDHGVIADALDDVHGPGPVSHLIRHQFGLMGAPAVENRHYNEVNGWYAPDDEHYFVGLRDAMPIGEHGPFALLMRHVTSEETPDASSWIVHAVSRDPAARGYGYTFEFPHSRAGEVPALFPAAGQFIGTDDKVNDWARRNGTVPERGRAQEGAHFEVHQMSRWRSGEPIEDHYARTDYGENDAYDHADFHRMILDNPHEGTNAGAYADWLEENGQPAAAQVIRRHVNRAMEDSEYPGENAGGLFVQYPRSSPGWTVNSGGYPGGYTVFHVTGPDTGTGGRLYWSFGEANPKIADNLASGLFLEGAVAEPGSFHNDTADSPHIRNQPLRWDAYKQATGHDLTAEQEQNLFGRTPINGPPEQLSRYADDRPSHGMSEFDGFAPHSARDVAALSVAAAHRHPEKRPPQGAVTDAVLDLGHPLADETMRMAREQGLEEHDVAMAHIHSPEFTHALLSAPRSIDDHSAHFQGGVMLPSGRMIRRFIGPDLEPRAGEGVGYGNLEIWPHTYYPLSHALVSHNVYDGRTERTFHHEKAVRLTDLPALVEHLPGELRGMVHQWMQSQVPEALNEPFVVQQEAPSFQREWGEPGNSVQSSRYGRTDYVDHTHAEFHNKILENTGEATSGLAYADWVEEQGHTSAAELIREHVRRALDDPYYDPDDPEEVAAYEAPRWQTATGSVGRFEVDTSAYQDGTTRFRMNHDATHEGAERPLWWCVDMPTEQADDLAARMFREGAVASSTSFHSPEGPDDRPLQASRYAHTLTADWTVHDSPDDMERAMARLSPAAKYALAPEGDTHAFMTQSIDNNHFDPNNSSDGPFADFLEEHGDPRHVIVRRDLSYRGLDRGDSASPDGYHTFMANYNGHREQIAGGRNSVRGPSRAFRLKDGTTIGVTDFLGTVNRQVQAHEVRFSGTRGSYVAAFSPEEHDQLMDALADDVQQPETHPDRLSRYADEPDEQWSDHAQIERDALLAAIHDNPFEATNHLAMADWHDERGEHDDAAFRRSMGKWMAANPGTHDIDPNGPRRADANRDLFPWYTEGPFGTPGGIPNGNFPDGVEHFPHWHHDWMPETTWVDRAEANRPRQPHDARWHGETYTFSWPTYQAMEQLFRENFKPPKQNFARYAAQSPSVRYDSAPRTGAPVNYSHDAFQSQIQADPTDKTVQAVYADWLEENAPEDLDERAEETLNLLRHHSGLLHVGPDPNTGAVVAHPIEIIHENDQFSGPFWTHHNPENGRCVVMGNINGPWGADVYDSVEDMENGRLNHAASRAITEQPNRADLLRDLKLSKLVHPLAEFADEEDDVP